MARLVYSMIPKPGAVVFPGRNSFQTKEAVRLQGSRRPLRFIKQAIFIKNTPWALFCECLLNEAQTITVDVVVLRRGAYVILSRLPGKVYHISLCPAVALISSLPLGE